MRPIQILIFLGLILGVSFASADPVSVWVGEAARFKGAEATEHRPDLKAKLRWYGLPVSSIEYHTTGFIYGSEDRCKPEYHNHFYNLETFTEPFRDDDTVCAVNVYRTEGLLLFSAKCWDNWHDQGTGGATRIILEVPHNAEKSFVSRLTVRPPSGKACRYRAEVNLVSLPEDEFHALNPDSDDPLEGLL